MYYENTRNMFYEDPDEGHKPNPVCLVIKLFFILQVLTSADLTEEVVDVMNF